MEPVLVLENVTRVYRRFFPRREVRAVDGLDLEIRRGEIFGLLGPNGSGKTTTILMVLGLLRPTGGRIEVFGCRPGDRATRRRIGYLPEEFEAHGFLTGEETLLYYGSFFGLPRAEVRRRAEDLLGSLELWDDRRRRVREYSKGMRRRIGLAQSLLHEPDLVVLDEPTNGLDPIGILRVKSMLRDLRDRGRTVLVSSHILPEMEDICDRVAILDRGRILAEGALGDLLARPDRHLIAVRGPTPDPAEIAALLGPKGLRVESVRGDRATLEEVFLKVVEGRQEVRGRRPEAS
jgi:ABC-2 type transport system ATP-binding protein